MRLKFLLASLLFMITFGGVYASFPVERTNGNTVTQQFVAGSEDVEDDNAVTLSSPAAGTSGKSQLVALLLCVFVGAMGIHRFYLGYITEGVLQLLTLGGCGVWALIDLIRIITGDLKPKGGNYSQTL
ncbi:TM2 domain-containing protein [Capnocytophaga canis]|uniref:TM2 domain-containing protein n=1 Tax=Capnocytophaga canis TaxID=1848903 RepID=A0A0B7HUM4_9FLAO|nr:TM2 domain-containing protein [Capnocytophaga canis]CEN43401.1 conserved membrane hypothetical protein [Capnocytophaga canis]